MFRASTFDKLLDKATSNLRLEPDWPTILQICDLIRQGDVNPKYAMNALKKKLTNPNPHVALFGFLVLESWVKNCGSLVHDEVGTKGYMEQLREIIRTYPHEDVKNKALELIQTWAFAFRNSSKYRAVQDTFNIMKSEGYAFPALKESDAMFSADTAPEWADGDCCHRCRVQFGVVQRKHHCRACGQVFCGLCSERKCTLPKFGIEKEVRVCDPCYDKQSRSVATSTKTEDLPSEHLSKPVAKQKQVPSGKSDEELREEEELQLAIALSQSEAESKKNTYRIPVSGTKSYSPPMVQKPNEYEKEDPELARYLNRSYWENRPVKNEKPFQQKDDFISINAISKHEECVGNGEYENEMDEFVNTLRNQVEVFVNRMKSNSSRGRPISTDSSIQSLFLNITAMHSRLLRYIQHEDDLRVYYEGLQDKLTQVKDARAALDALREEHRDRLRREAEMAERQRQLQMAQKLEIMRQKKQEYLQYQRNLALQRIHDEELELQMRQEQQKQHYRIGTYNQLPYMPPQPASGSAFEPVGIRGISSMPPSAVSTGSYMQPSHIPMMTYSGHYAQVPQQGHATVTPHQQMQSSISVGQGHIPPTSYISGNHPSQASTLPGHLGPRNHHPGNLPQDPIHSGHLPPQDQMISSHIPSQNQMLPNHGPSQNQMLPSHGPSQNQMLSSHGQSQNQAMPVHMPTAQIPNRGQPIHHQQMYQVNQSMMRPPTNLDQQYRGSTLQQPQLILNSPQHQVLPNNIRLQQPSPMSSPSSSSEHSVTRQGPPPVPSAPSASSTPQPVEKEEVTELISFD